MNDLIFEKNDGVGVITLNRKEARNSINASLAEKWLDALDQCREDKSIRVVVITGAGRAFCAGQDLKEVQSISTVDGFRNLLDERYTPLIRSISSMPKPVIAAVNGTAAGAGASMALACDLVLAVESSSFVQAFSGIGLIPDSGATYFLPRLVGTARAMAYALLGEKVSAREAERVGMIYRCYAESDFEEAWKSLAARLSKGPTLAYALTKRAFQQSQSNSLEQQLELEAKLQIRATQSDDCAEGLRAFVEKRKPLFNGH